MNEKIKNVRVSSKSSNKLKMIDSLEDSCWTSSPGMKHSILLELLEESPLNLSGISLCFQGGFSAREMELHLDDVKIQTFFPLDNNENQIFNLTNPLVVYSKILLLFPNGSTDTFGRITIYKLELL
jgi:hypothetical protein